MELKSLNDESDLSMYASSPLSPNGITEWRQYHDKTSVAAYKAPRLSTNSLFPNLLSRKASFDHDAATSTSGSRDVALTALQEEVASLRGLREEVAELRVALATITTRLDSANELAMDTVQAPEGLGKQVDTLAESVKSKVGEFNAWKKTMGSSLSTLERNVQSLKQVVQDDNVAINQKLQSLSDSLHDSLHDVKSFLDNMLDLFPRLLVSYVAASSTSDAKFSLKMAGLGPPEREVVAAQLKVKEQLTAQGLLDIQAEFKQLHEEISSKKKLVVVTTEHFASEIEAMIEIGVEV